MRSEVELEAERSIVSNDGEAEDAASSTTGASAEVCDRSRRPGMSSGVVAVGAVGSDQTPGTAVPHAKSSPSALNAIRSVVVTAISSQWATGFGKVTTVGVVIP